MLGFSEAWIISIVKAYKRLASPMPFNYCNFTGIGVFIISCDDSDIRIEPALDFVYYPL